MKRIFIVFVFLCFLWGCTGQPSEQSGSLPETEPTLPAANESVPAPFSGLNEAETVHTPAGSEAEAVVSSGAVIPEAEIILPAHTSLAVWDESTWQVGAPLSPQPGDTTATWDPSRIGSYPLDGACSDMELLEKWMDVEGLTFADLEERGCRQLVLTVARGTDGVETFTVCYQKQGDTWETALPRMQGWVGKKGIMHDRQRDSLMSPAGLWSLGLAFGNSPRPDGLKLPWRDVTPYSDWVCDLDSPYYNTWQERNDPELVYNWSDDVEHLENYPSAYAYACVIRYNTAPYIIGSRGCAIFFHCSKRATEGCVGLPQEDFLQVLTWLDPAENPHILISGYQL